MSKIFILHGWTYSTDKWQPLISQLEGQGFSVTALAVPGLTEQTDKVWALEDYVEWLKEKLAQEIDPILIGHSNGGRIALAFAVANPKKLKQLILIDSAGIYHNELPIRLKRLIFGKLAQVGKKISSSETLRNLLYKFARENDYRAATPQMRQTMANLIKVDLTSKLSLIKTPTLIIWGEKDKITPSSDAELMHKFIEHSNLFLIPEAGHSPHATHANVVFKRIMMEVRP